MAEEVDVCDGHHRRASLVALLLHLLALLLRWKASLIPCNLGNDANVPILPPNLPLLRLELETKDGRTHFVPRVKKPKQKKVETDVDLTVLALESPPDGFLSLSNGPYDSLADLDKVEF
ncbi:hypothetical protein Lser_V15G13448 [Lactuca serriola]